MAYPEIEAVGEVHVVRGVDPSMNLCTQCCSKSQDTHLHSWSISVEKHRWKSGKY